MTGHKTMLLMFSLVRGEGTPTDLIERIRSDAGVKIGLAGVYAQLDRLEQSGLAKSRVGKDDKGRSRRWYRLTAEGHSLLTELELAKGGVSLAV